MKLYKVLAFAGSLRKNSYNRGLLLATIALAPKNLNIKTFDLKNIPLYNQELVDNREFPQAVTDFKNEIEKADCLLIATPEYDYSIPGVLKNSLDWATRPYGNNSLFEKRIAVIGASTSGFGTVRAQIALMPVFYYSAMKQFNKKELMVSDAQEKFAADGTLTDPKTTEKLKEFVSELGKWLKNE